MANNFRIIRASDGWDGDHHTRIYVMHDYFSLVMPNGRRFFFIGLNHNSYQGYRMHLESGQTHIKIEGKWYRAPSNINHFRTYPRA